jgi:thiol:disulfide interchange protein
MQVHHANRSQTSDSLARKSGYAGSFFTSVLATVVATPCTAPLMGAAVGFALSQSALVTFSEHSRQIALFAMSLDRSLKLKVDVNCVVAAE